MNLRAVSLPAAWSRVHINGIALSYIGIGLVALLLRVLDLGGFVTPDERLHWIARSGLFLQAIRSGNYGDTAIHLHPGVTTMWLGALGILLRETLKAWGMLQPEAYATQLALMRLPVVLAHVGGILAGYALLRRMLPATIAALAALFWAADPFAIAFSRVLHVDALTMTFSTLAVLAACLFWNHPQPGRSGGLPFLMLSGICTALAILSKLSAVALGPAVAIIALLAARAEPGAAGGEQARPPFYLLALPALLRWGLVVLLTIVLVWPAVWAAPLRVVGLVRGGFGAELTEPHTWGNFFLGQPLDTPGLNFYPAALVMRLTPWTLGGLLLLPVLFGQAARQRLRPHHWRDLAALLVFIIVFLVVVSAPPKKFNRYLVPVFPAADVLAAVGLCWGLGHLLSSRLPRSGRRLHAALLAGVACLAVANAAWWHPYSIAAFNQALGGAQAGARTFLIGWGEGLEQAAAWLNQQPDITGVTTGSTIPRGLRPYMRHGAFVTDEAGLADYENVAYLVIYIRQVQQGGLGPLFQQIYGRQPPLHVVRIHGVDYVWIYSRPLPVDHVVDAQFSQGIALQGYGVDSSALRSSGMLTVTTQWHSTAPVAENYMLFVHLLDARGTMVGQADVLPAGPDCPTPVWEAHRYLKWQHPLPAAANLPAGEYWLSLGLYDPASFSRLPLQAPAPPGAPDDGPDALLLGPLRIGD